MIVEKNDLIHFAENKKATITLPLPGQSAFVAFVCSFEAVERFRASIVLLNINECLACQEKFQSLAENAIGLNLEGCN
jgi:hypothetical protein